MPELNFAGTEGFTSENTDNIPFKEKAREKQRLEKLKNAEAILKKYE